MWYSEAELNFFPFIKKSLLGAGGARLPQTFRFCFRENFQTVVFGDAHTSHHFPDLTVSILQSACKVDEKEHSIFKERFWNEKSLRGEHSLYESN